MSEITGELANDVLDREQIDLLLSLDDGNGKVLAEIVAEFLTTSADVRAQLLHAFGEGDLPAAQRASHTLKGASSNVGAARLAEVCAEVEARAGEAELDEAVGLIEQFELEYARALDALQGLNERD
jgi:HPt (histidine-containing phosphotransfer) domain-containing protein